MPVQDGRDGLRPVVEGAEEMETEAKFPAVVGHGDEGNRVMGQDCGEIEETSHSRGRDVMTRGSPSHRLLRAVKPDAPPAFSEDF